MHPRVSVIVPTYNSSATLQAALSTLTRQTFTDFEAWVVGDACTDDSESVVRAFKDDRLHWVNLSVNTGSQSGPNNAGLERATGTYIAYLNHDDLWFPWHLEALVGFMEETGADFAHSLGVGFGADGRISAYGPVSRGRTYENDFVHPSTWMHRKDLLSRTGPWRPYEEVATGVDAEFSRRTYQSGATMRYLPRLSAILFPAFQWKTYALTRDWPQHGYLDELRSDPEGLRVALLEACSEELGYLRNARPRAVDSLVHSFKLFYHEVLEWYGKERWPVSAFWLWRYQRRRRRSYRQRGLETLRANKEGLRYEVRA